MLNYSIKMKLFGPSEMAEIEVLMNSCCENMSFGKVIQIHC